jgi:hypothetical protein
VVGPVARAAAGEMKHPPYPVPSQAKVKLAFVLLEKLVGPGIEDPDLSRAVVALRDRSREGSVFDGMVLHVDREAGPVVVQGKPLGYRPRRQDGL